jgi:hypothetical protein
MHGANIAIGTFGRFACQLPERRFSQRPDQSRQTRRKTAPTGALSSERPFAHP